MGLTPYEQQEIPEKLKQYDAALNASEISVTDLQTRIKEIEASRVQQTNELKKKMLEAKIEAVRLHIERYERDSQPYALLAGVLEQLQALGKKAAAYDTIPKWKEVLDGPGKNLSMFSSWMNQYITKDLDELGTQIDRITQDGEKAVLDLKSCLAKNKDYAVKIEETKNGSRRPTTPCARKRKSGKPSKMK